MADLKAMTDYRAKKCEVVPTVQLKFMVAANAVQHKNVGKAYVKRLFRLLDRQTLL